MLNKKQHLYLRAIKIGFISLFLIVSLSGCSSSDESVNSSVYNPPVWIQGTWGFKATTTGTGQDESYFKFTSNNLCQLTFGDIITTCWKEMTEVSPKIYSGSENSSSDSYEIKLIAVDGIQSVTLKFKKVSATKIIWVNSGSNIELEKLN